MERYNVSSSTIKSIGYDEDDKTLEIEFNDGSIYQYFQVPQKVMFNLMNSVTYGKFFYDQIRDKYAFSLIREKTIVNNDYAYGEPCVVCGKGGKFNKSSNTCDSCVDSIMGDYYKEALDASEELWGYTDGDGIYHKYYDD